MTDNLQLVGDSIMDLETGTYVHYAGDFLYLDDNYFHMLWECYMEYLDMIMSKEYD